MKPHVRWGIAACLVLIVTATACGRKTEPLIPPSPRPEAVKDIKIAARDEVAFLSWPIPARNVEGVSMNPADIIRFRIYRGEYGRDHNRGRFKIYAEINTAAPAPAVIRDNVCYWSDGNVKYGQTYGYQIRALSARGGISQLSEEVRVTPVMPLAVPTGFIAIGVDGYNLLTWEPVKTWLDGSAATGYVGYNIYRGTEKGRYENTPLNKEPIRKTSYTDEAVINDHTYYYVIRSVANPTPPFNESLDSAEISATPRKLTPPARPTGLTAVPGVGRVFLTWDENRERDIAGYRVYRSTKSGRNYILLTEKLLTRTTYSDETVENGVTYFYVITAVDQSGNESGWSAEAKARTERLK